MTTVHVLTINYTEGRLGYQLTAGEQPRRGALFPEIGQPVSKATLDELERSAYRLLRSAAGPTFEADAEARGRSLFGTLIPAKLEGELATIDGPLQIRTSLHGIPWEMLHDGTQFWGLRYGGGRQLVIEGGVQDATPLAAGPYRPRAFVIGANPKRDLDFVEAETEAVARTLDKYCDVRCVCGPMASFDEVSDTLQRPFDIVHFAGHVVGGSKAPGLMLARREVLRADVVKGILTCRTVPSVQPLVFINGCTSARGANRPPSRNWSSSFSSIANSFLFGGACGVIGTLSDVTDEQAAQLAAAFYQGLFTGLTVGEALRAARCKLRKLQPHSPAWLSFVLYGDPGLRLVDPAESSESCEPSESPVSETVETHDDTFSHGTPAARSDGGTCATIGDDVPAYDAPRKRSLDRAPLAATRAGFDDSVTIFDLSGHLDPRRVTLVVAHILQDAVTDAKTLGHAVAEPLHIMIATAASEPFLKTGDHAPVLHAMNGEQRRRVLYQLIESPLGPAIAPTEPQERQFSPEAQDVLRKAAASEPPLDWTALLDALNRSSTLAGHRPEYAALNALMSRHRPRPPAPAIATPQEKSEN